MCLISLLLFLTSLGIQSFPEKRRLADFLQDVFLLDFHTAKKAKIAVICKFLKTLATNDISPLDFGGTCSSLLGKGPEKRYSLCPMRSSAKNLRLVGTRKFSTVESFQPLFHMCSSD